MRNHIVFKFAAVFLAALVLLTALASAAGIIGLASLNLYEETVDELYQEQTESSRRTFAVNLAHRYASLNLGDLPQSYLDQYYGIDWQFNTFEYGKYGYKIINEKGQVVESLELETDEVAFVYDVVVTNINYRSVISISSGENPTAWDSTEAVTYPPFREDTFETTIDPATEAVDTTSEDAGLAVASDTEEAVYSDWYYDYEADGYVEFSYRYAELPPYTVTLYLLPGAMPDEPLWGILRAVYDLRDILGYVLGISLLVYAMLLVYLCCAAGRKPGREEVHAGGLNCVPLDLYLLTAGGGILLLVVLGYHTLSYCIRHAPQLILTVGIALGYGCTLLATGFLFASAAQFKTPGGYWWRNTVTGRCLQLGFRFLRFCWRLVKKRWRMAPETVKKGFLLLRNILFWGFSVLRTILLWFWKKLARVFQWAGGKLARFYGLLPLTWQWLLTGFVMALLLFFAFGSRSEGWTLIFLASFAGIILYGASAFGILLESARRMRSGDLETKVSDQFLSGSFRDFAGELNGLADVAVVAAQKQLKSERMKTELITNVSHDIKTPLTSIINYVDLLQKPHSPEDQAVYLEVLDRQSQRLKKLVDDLMEMSKASTGNIAAEITRLNAGEAVNQALGEFADKLEKANLTPLFRQPETPVYIMADGRLVWRVLSNLLSNAVKYALPGTRLYLDLMELEGKVVISLKNISREELNIQAEELLERFVRGDAARNTEGSGLGLNIAKSLMELQKGELQLLVDGDLFKVTLVFPGA